MYNVFANNSWNSLYTDFKQLACMITLINFVKVLNNDLTINVYRRIKALRQGKNEHERNRHRICFLNALNRAKR